MRISIRQRAGEHERFGPSAFDSQLGQKVPLTVGDQFDGIATLVAADVSTDGSEVEVAFEVPDSGVAAEFIRHGRPGEFSFGPSASLYTVRPTTGAFPIVRDDPHLNIASFIVRDARSVPPQSPLPSELEPAEHETAEADRPER